MGRTGAGIGAGGEPPPSIEGSGLTGLGFTAGGCLPPLGELLDLDFKKLLKLFGSVTGRDGATGVNLCLTPAVDCNSASVEISTVRTVAGSSVVVWTATGLDRERNLDLDGKVSLLLGASVSSSCSTMTGARVVGLVVTLCVTETGRPGFCLLLLKKECLNLELGSSTISGAGAGVSFPSVSSCGSSVTAAGSLGFWLLVNSEFLLLGAWLLSWTGASTTGSGKPG